MTEQPPLAWWEQAGLERYLTLPRRETIDGTEKCRLVTYDLVDDSVVEMGEIFEPPYY